MQTDLDVITSFFPHRGAACHQPPGLTAFLGFIIFSDIALGGMGTSWMSCMREACSIQAPRTTSKACELST